MLIYRNAYDFVFDVIQQLTQVESVGRCSQRFFLTSLTTSSSLCLKVQPMPCTALSRSCGLYKVLGAMIGHSISQDGVGFPFLSPACYYYMVGGDEIALEHISMNDIGADVASVITKVRITLPYRPPIFKLKWGG